MANQKITQFTEATSFSADTDLIPIVVNTDTTPANRKMTKANLKLELTSDIQIPLEWSAQVFQSGTNDPIPQTPQVSTILVNDIITSPTDFRDVAFGRTGVGEYWARVRYTTSTVPTDTSKLALMFGDAVPRITQTSTGVISGYNYKQWTFETRTPTGTLSDTILLGNNGGYVNIKLYP